MHIGIAFEGFLFVLPLVYLVANSHTQFPLGNQAAERDGASLTCSNAKKRRAIACVDDHIFEVEHYQRNQGTTRTHAHTV